MLEKKAVCYLSTSLCYGREDTGNSWVFVLSGSGLRGFGTSDLVSSPTGVGAELQNSGDIEKGVQLFLLRFYFLFVLPLPAQEPFWREKRKNVRKRDFFLKP